MTPLPRLASHGLASPTAGDFSTALRAVAGPAFPALWGQVCDEAGLSQGAFLLELAQQERLAQVVAALPGELGLVGRGLAARVASYRELSAAAVAGVASSDWSRRCLDQLLRNRLPVPGRLADVTDLDLFGLESRQRLCDSARRAANHFRTPMAGITVVLDQALLYPGSYGMDPTWVGRAGGIPLEWSFCVFPVRSRQPYVLADARADVVHRTNPVVRHDGLASYAGAPLITRGGHAIGALCLMDGESRTYSTADVAALAALAREVTDQMESYRLSTAPTCPSYDPV